MTGPKLDDVPAAVAHAVAEALGDALDCTRTWSAGRHRTMGPSDFYPISQDGDRVTQIALAAITAWEASKPQPAPAIDLERILGLSDSWLAQAERVRASAPDKANGLWAAAKELRDMLALIDGQAGGQSHPDTDRLNFIEGECLTVEAVSVRASEDDADVAWVISQHHMGRGQVVLHRSHDDNLRRAIDAVMQPTKGEGE